MEKVEIQHPDKADKSFTTGAYSAGVLAAGDWLFVSGQAAVDFTTSTAVGRTTSLLAGLVSFEKPRQDVINITVELKNSSTTTTNPLVNGYAEKTTNPLGQWSLMCDIYGIIN